MAIIHGYLLGALVGQSAVITFSGTLQNAVLLGIISLTTQQFVAGLNETTLGISHADWQAITDIVVRGPAVINPNPETGGI